MEALLYHVSVAEDKKKNYLLGNKSAKHYGNIEMLYQLGSNAFNDMKVVKGIDKVVEIRHDFGKRREDLPMRLMVQ